MRVFGGGVGRDKNRDKDRDRAEQDQTGDTISEGQVSSSAKTAFATAGVDVNNDNSNTSGELGGGSKDIFAPVARRPGRYSLAVSPGAVLVEPSSQFAERKPGGRTPLPNAKLLSRRASYPIHTQTWNMADRRTTSSTSSRCNCGDKLGLFAVL